MQCSTLSPFSKRNSLGLPVFCTPSCTHLFASFSTQLPEYTQKEQWSTQETQASLDLLSSATSTKYGRTITMETSGSAAYLKVLQVLKSYAIKDPKRAIPPHAKGPSCLVLCSNSSQNQIPKYKESMYKQVKY